ncbi:DUF3043 domain-containing protein [Actinomyces urinae]|uniref:DUF3043 domain-containing protein n=1 Tax=Actinomyces urinae TaxID=1689268 RepID=UPI001E35A768|nr:DUF3043 domain-containing protein [Actinomyces urinae]
MFGKEKSKDNSGDQAHEVVGKGRPTRSRKEAEAANRRPMIPKDRREAKRRRRERENALWERQQRAMETGDERYMPARDKGRIRRFTRDYVDARWTLAEFVLPMMLVLIIAMFSMIFLARLTTPETAALVVQVVTYLTYGMLIFSVFESILINMQIKKITAQKWPNEPWVRNWFYTFSRMIMLRRWRQPRPQVKRGEHPEK